MPHVTIIAPQHLDIIVPADSDYDLVWTLTDDDGTVVDISEDTVAMTVFRKRTDAEPLIEFANAPGEHTTPVSGITTFTFVPGDTAWLEKSEELVRYEVWRIFDSGTKRLMWFEGFILFTNTRGVETS